MLPDSVSFFYVEKNDGGLRPCINYHGFEQCFVRYPYPLPLVPTSVTQTLCCFYPCLMPCPDWDLETKILSTENLFYLQNVGKMTFLGSLILNLTQPCHIMFSQSAQQIKDTCLQGFVAKLPGHTHHLLQFIQVPDNPWINTGQIRLAFHG